MQKTRLTVRVHKTNGNCQGFLMAPMQEGEGDAMFVTPALRPFALSDIVEMEIELGSRGNRHVLSAKRVGNLYEGE